MTRWPTAKGEAPQEAGGSDKTTLEAVQWGGDKTGDKDQSQDWEPVTTGSQATEMAVQGKPEAFEAQELMYAVT